MPALPDKDELIESERDTTIARLAARKADPSISR